jgi:uncharacterized protein YcfJ
MNHILLISISAASLLLTGNAFANHESSIPYRDQYRDQPPFETSRTIEDTASYEYADVISVEPIIERVEVPVSGKVCWDEEVYHRHPRYRSGVPQIFGSIIGGVIGNQFGGGRGKDVMTFAGAAMGAAVARDVQEHNGRGEQYATTELRCEIETDYREEDTVVGYNVTYDYLGETYRARMDYPPKDKIRVRVSVAPIGG